MSRPEPARHHKISHDPAALEALFVDFVREAHERAPEKIVLDLFADRTSTDSAAYIRT